LNIQIQIRSILKRRNEETNGVKHNDFLQLMINANKKTDNEEHNEDSVNNENFMDNQIKLNQLIINLKLK